MKNQLNKVMVKWKVDGIKLNAQTTDKEIFLFQDQNNLIIPIDLVEYFKMLNGTNNEYDKKLFRFYSFNEFQKLSEKFNDWEGIPDYKDIINTLTEHNECYIFADYCFHLFSYAIHLHNKNAEQNKVFILCGNEYKIIANSFHEFISLYIDDSIELYFND